MVICWIKLESLRHLELSSTITPIHDLALRERLNHNKMRSRLPHSDALYICHQCRSLAKKQQRTHRTFTSTTSRRKQQPEIYDVITVGGGPAGLSLLTALKSHPSTSHLKTALIESQSLSKLRDWSPPTGSEYSNRASSLTPSSVSFLEDQCGVWKHVDQSRVQAYDEMQVWDGGNDSSLQFDWSSETSKYNAPPRTVATMTENANLTKGLLDRIAELGAAESLIGETSVKGIENGEDDPEGLDLRSWPVLTLERKSSTAPKTIAARLLVGADGFNSPVRAFAGIASHGWDYQRHGVVATLRIQPPLDETDDFDLFASEPLPNRATAYQRFLPALGGPIAILPLPNNHASLVWSTTPTNATYLKSLPPAAQVSMINAALRLSQTDIKYMFTLPSSASSSSNKHEEELNWRLQHTPPPPISRQPPLITSIQSGTMASFPLRFRHASSLIAPRVALIGDAAHTIHPMAGQGLNLGLADSHSLARTIQYAVERGMDIGDSNFSLEGYNRERFGKGLVMGGGVDMLNWAYQLGGGGDGILSAAIGRARGLGMGLVGMVPGLREGIMRGAS
jgi:ubiquinone biosynthesis monooxygenase Coq6